MNNRDLAVYMGRLGFYVFPCVSEGELIKSPYYGVMWKQQSTCIESEINKFWQFRLSAVPGIDMWKSGLIAIDCDSKKSDGLAWLNAQGWGDMGDIPGSYTPNGGRHLIFRNQCGYGDGRGNLPDKTIADIDVKGKGYIIAPGSIMADGRRYVPIGDLRYVLDMPDWAVDLLRPPEPPARNFALVGATVISEPVSDFRKQAYGQAALEGIENELIGTGFGGWSDAAWIAACRVGNLIAGDCISEGEGRGRLLAAVGTWGRPPRDKLYGPRGTIERGLRRGRSTPRGPDDLGQWTVEIDYDEETGEVIEEIKVTPNLTIASPPPQPPPTNEIPEYLLDVPGLVGRIMQFIVKTSLYPQPPFSLGAALVIVGTACGRQTAGPTRSGTHLYTVGLGPSGSGKDHPLAAIPAILAAAGLKNHIGPSQFISMPSVINFLIRTPLAACAMDEFGSFLKRINHRRASGFEGAISGLLRSAWGCSFKPLITPEWANRAAVMVYSPALSIFGVSTPSEFYAALENGDVMNGVLNRFLLIATGIRPSKQEPEGSLNDVPTDIMDDLRAIYYRNPLATLTAYDVVPAIDEMTFSESGRQIYEGLDIELKRLIDASPELEPFYARTTENAVRLATIRAIGQDSWEVGEADMVWGRDLALWSTRRLAAEAGLYIADTDNQSMANSVKRALAGKGRVIRGKLIRMLQHKYKARELEDVLNQLTEADEVTVEIGKMGPKGGRVPRWYTLNP